MGIIFCTINEILRDFLSFPYWGFRSQVEFASLSYELFTLASVKPLLFEQDYQL